MSNLQRRALGISLFVVLFFAYLYAAMYFAINARGEDMPPLLLEHYIVYVVNSPTSVGEPPEPVGYCAALPPVCPELPK
jgi:hypothetical protein